MAKQNDTRYFLIEHKDCGTIILNTAKYEKSLQVRNEIKIVNIHCPSCWTPIIENRELMNLFELYGKLTTQMLSEGFTMREIQFEDL